jgi:hypothetical protein
MLIGRFASSRLARGACPTRPLHSRPISRNHAHLGVPWSFSTGSHLSATKAVEGRPACISGGSCPIRSSEAVHGYRTLSPARQARPGDRVISSCCPMKERCRPATIACATAALPCATRRSTPGRRAGPHPDGTTARAVTPSRVPSSPNRSARSSSCGGSGRLRTVSHRRSRSWRSCPSKAQT